MTFCLWDINVSWILVFFLSNHIIALQRMAQLGGPGRCQWSVRCRPRYLLTPGRTINRIRFPYEVLFRCVEGKSAKYVQMLGWGSALRTGRKAPCSDDMTDQALLEDFWMGTGSHLGEDHLVK